MRRPMGPVEDFLENTKFPGEVLFAKLWGSRSHNTHLPDSDWDYTGVFLMPTSRVLSLFAEPDTITADAPDYQFYEAKRFCELLLKGNPALVEMLFTERHFVSTAQWEVLRDQGARFLSCQVVSQYLGYMDGQLKKLKSHAGTQGLHTRGGAYNEKFAYHMLRLAADVRRIATGQPPVVWKEGEERDFLLKVRAGRLPYEECRDRVEEVIAEVHNLKPYPLPEHGDKQLLNDWLLGLRRKW